MGFTVSLYTSIYVCFLDIVVGGLWSVRVGIADSGKVPTATLSGPHLVSFTQSLKQNVNHNTRRVMEPHITHIKEFVTSSYVHKTQCSTMSIITKTQNMHM